MLSPETYRKFRVSSSKIGVRRATSPVIIWSGLASEDTDLLFPWIDRSLITTSPGNAECFFTAE